MSLNASPAIACIGVIGKYDNPLTIQLFPPHTHSLLEMSFILNSSLDIFATRRTTKLLDQDLGLLHAIDERLAVYGWLTNTGIKFVIVVDMGGRPASTEDVLPLQKRGGSAPPVVGLRDSDLKPAFRAVHTAYVQLLMNPFYTPEDRTPLQQVNYGRGPEEITSKKFISELQRIGKAWVPGLTSL